MSFSTQTMVPLSTTVRFTLVERIAYVLQQGKATLHELTVLSQHLRFLSTEDHASVGYVPALRDTLSAIESR